MQRNTYSKNIARCSLVFRIEGIAITLAMTHSAAEINGAASSTQTDKGHEKSPKAFSELR